MSSGEYYSVLELEAALGVTRPTLKKMREARVLPSSRHKVGRMFYTKKSDVQHLVSARQAELEQSAGVNMLAVNMPSDFDSEGSVFKRNESLGRILASHNLEVGDIVLVVIASIIIDVMEVAKIDVIMGVPVTYLKDSVESTRRNLLYARIPQKTGVSKHHAEYVLRRPTDD